MPTVSENTNLIDGYEDKYIKENGKDTPYYQTVRVEDYSQLEGSGAIQPDIVKKITVIIKYRSGNEDQEIALSTSMSNNKV